MQRNLAGALVVALALVAAGCGDSSKPLTTAQLRTQASAVCRDVRRQVVGLQARATQATLSRSLRQAADAIDGGVERLRALDPPPRLDRAYAELVAWKATQRDAALALAKQPGRRLAGREGRAIDAHIDAVGRAARATGLSACA
jgi:hypothetical protein